MREDRPMLQTALTVLPIVTAGLYLLGLTYHQGFLEGFGIEETLFPLSVDRTLFQGFVASMMLGAKPFFYSLVAASAIFLTAVLGALISSSQRVRALVRSISAWLRRVIRRQPVSDTGSQWVDKAGVVCVYIIAGFMIYLALLLVALVSTKGGKEQAQLFIAKAAQSKEGYVTLYISENSAPVIGKPIMCGASHCAFWLGKEAVLYSSDVIVRVIMHNPSLQVTPASGRP